VCLKEKVKVGNTRSKDKDIKDNQCVDGKTGPVLGLLGFLINCLLPTASKEKGKEGSRGKTVDKTKSPCTGPLERIKEGRTTRRHGPKGQSEVSSI